jgi:formate hydrogenlyase transcriptional activator
MRVHHFTQKYARKRNKRIDTVPAEALKAMEEWAWPGNVRELENFIERSVIFSEGPVLNVPLADLRPRAALRKFGGQGAGIYCSRTA